MEDDVGIKHDHEREDWQSSEQPVTSTSAFPGWDKIKRIVIHYPGADFADMDFDNDEDIDLDDTRILLRNTQNYYLHKSPPYSIGYNTAVGYEGHSWECRGDTFKCAANQEVNSDSYAIIVMVDGDAPANPAQVRKVRELIAQIRALAKWDVPYVTHHSVSLNTTNTSCPGTGIVGQIASRVFDPQNLEPDIPSGVPMLKRGSKSPDVLKLRQWLVWFNFMTRKPTQRFGPVTEAALKALQKKIGVKTDGIYGPVTARAFREYILSR